MMSQNGLRVPANRVEKRAVVYWTLQALATVVSVAGVLAVLNWLWESARPVVSPALIVVVGVGVLYAAGMPTWRYVVHRWETTAEAVYARSGWYVREWRVAPISRIQTVDTSRGPIEQMLGLATLTVTTASSSGAIKISGLDEETAIRQAERLTEITQLTPGDQT